jgi:prepilin peptidase dependent protein B
MQLRAQAVQPGFSIVRQRGLSIIETMVGLTIGLFIVGAALKLFIDNIDSNRRLLVETRVNQDLRAAADLIARDLRRAGYWQQAASGVWQPTAAAVPNPNAAIGAPPEVTYRYDKNATEVYEAGFRLSSGKIQMRTAANTWQDITDPSTMRVPENGLEVTPIVRVVDLLSRCGAAVSTCAGNPLCPPTLTIRQYAITLRGEAVADPAVKREIKEVVRVRNDQFSGECP